MCGSLGLLGDGGSYLDAAYVNDLLFLLAGLCGEESRNHQNDGQSPDK